MMPRPMIVNDGAGSSTPSGRYIYYNGRVEKVFNNTGASDSKAGSPKSSGKEPSTKEKVKKRAKREVSRKSIQMLQGSLNIIPDVEFKARNVYSLTGLGSIFDGNYYIEQCNHTISRGGYNVTASVIKVDKAALDFYQGSRRTKVSNQVSTKKYTAKKGETTKSIAKKHNTSEKALKSLNVNLPRGVGANKANMQVLCPY